MLKAYQVETLPFSAAVGFSWLKTPQLTDIKEEWVFTPSLPLLVRFGAEGC